jgi:hypothetical protein
VRRPPRWWWREYHRARRAFEQAQARCEKHPTTPNLQRLRATARHLVEVEAQRVTT